VSNDFSNCNLQSLNATFVNNGRMCTGNDFINCGTDTLRGSGNYFVVNAASNLGVFTGTHFFNAGSFFQGGTLDPGVTIGQALYNISVDEINDDVFYIQQNPAENVIVLKSSKQLHEVSIVNTIGQIVLTDNQQELFIGQLSSGEYTVITKFEDGSVAKERLIKR